MSLTNTADSNLNQIIQDSKVEKDLFQEKLEKKFEIDKVTRSNTTSTFLFDLVYEINE